MNIKKFSKFTHNILILFTLCILTFPLFGQEGRFGNAWVNADGSTTFHFEDSTAKNVKIICDCRLHRETLEIKKENYHKAKMQKDSTGVWTYTTPPLAPEVYTYMFEAEGKRSNDPKNPDSIRVRCDRMSTFIVDGTPQTQLYTSKPLKDFIYESNKGKDVFFVSTEEEAVDMMLAYSCYKFAVCKLTCPL